MPGHAADGICHGKSVEPRGTHSFGRRLRGDRLKSSSCRLRALAEPSSWQASPSSPAWPWKLFPIDSRSSALQTCRDHERAITAVACAVQQRRIDPRKIYAMGASAGAIQTTWMSYAKSGYLAATATLSGGLPSLNGTYFTPTILQDPTHVPAAMVTHGATGVDVIVIDFAVASADWEADIQKKGGFSIDCNTGGGHVSGPPQIGPAIWQFFQDHPFKVEDDYTSGLPSVFPSYCQIGPRKADGGAAP